MAKKTLRFNITKVDYSTRYVETTTKELVLFPFPVKPLVENGVNIEYLF